jgi:hypothetical protein
MPNIRHELFIEFLLKKFTLPLPVGTACQHGGRLTLI